MMRPRVPRTIPRTTPQEGLESTMATERTNKLHTADLRQHTEHLKMNYSCEVGSIQYLTRATHALIRS